MSTYKNHGVEITGKKKKDEAVTEITLFMSEALSSISGIRDIKTKKEKDK